MKKYSLVLVFIFSMGTYGFAQENNGIQKQITSIEQRTSKYVDQLSKDLRIENEALLKSITEIERNFLISADKVKAEFKKDKNKLKQSLRALNNQKSEDLKKILPAPQFEKYQKLQAEKKQIEKKKIDSK